MKNFIKIFSICIILFLIVCIISILHIQQSLFFYPWHDEVSYNQLLTQENFEEVKINNNGNLLSGWIKYTDKEKSPLVIFFGGNAQNSSNTCINFLNNDLFKYFNGYNLLIVDYPGYGLSDGYPSDKTMFDASLKIYDYASQLTHIDKDNIVVLGYSIGTGVATYLSSQRDINGLILVSPYDEALSLYNDNLNIFHGPLKILAKYKFKSIEYAKNIDVSPLIFTSKDDEVIDWNFSVNLSKYFNTVEDVIILEGVRHNDYFAQKEVLEKIYQYLHNRVSNTDTLLWF